ncbi:MAG: carbohydrate-binding domain-containing protein [Bacteroidaceae bacterium]|nr:carbohydrate-binding domain-containing protein [Bacteroidaceae bacterium]
MKKVLATLCTTMLCSSAIAQSIYICKDGDFVKKDIYSGLEIQEYINNCDSITFEEPKMEKMVKIAFSNDKASVIIPSHVNGVTCFSNTSTDVVISNINTNEEITYYVSGTCEDGSLTISGEYKLTLNLNGLNLASKKGAAINLQCGKRNAIVLSEGTTNSISDATGGEQKACLYSKGHIEFEGAGTLNVTGNSNHAIAAKEYTQIKKSTGTINIIKSANDAIHTGQYFQMNGGTLNIDGNTTNDGVQAEMTNDPADEHNGEIIIKGGNINITLNGAEDAKAIKAEKDINISGGTFTINANSNGSRGIQTDGNITISEQDSPTNITIYATGGKCTIAEDSDDPHKCMGIKVDGDLTVNAGTIAIYNTGKKAKGIKVGGEYNNNGGTVNAIIE